MLVPELEHLARRHDDELGAAPRAGAGRRDGGARRHRPPLPRRRRSLARLGDDGAADQRTARGVLAGRPARGVRRGLRGRARGAPAGAASRTTATAATGTPTTSRRTASRRTAARSPRPRRSGPTWDRRGTSRRSTGPPYRRSMLARGLEELAKAGKSALFGVESADDLPFAVDDALVTARGRRGRARAAEDGGAARAPDPGRPTTVRSSRWRTVIGPEAFGREYFSLAKGTPGPNRRERLGDRPVRRPRLARRLERQPSAEATCTFVQTCSAVRVNGTCLALGPADHAQLGSATTTTAEARCPTLSRGPRSAGHPGRPSWTRRTADVGRDRESLRRKRLITLASCWASRRCCCGAAS